LPPPTLGLRLAGARQGRLYITWTLCKLARGAWFLETGFLLRSPGPPGLCRAGG